MVVIAVVALLGAVALPIFNNYLTRARATEFQSATATARVAMSEWAMLNAAATAWPATNVFGSSAFQFTGDYVTGVTYQRATAPTVAAIEVTGAVDGQSIVMYLEGTLSSGRVTWKCTAASDSLSWLPSSCSTPVTAGLGTE